MRKLKIGDRVRILKEGYYNNQFKKGDIVYIVGAVHNEGGACPWYLSKDKQRLPRDGHATYFGPYGNAYEYVPNKNTVGGHILTDAPYKDGGKILC